MSEYLTNTSLDNEERCIWAAKKSGFNVTFERSPMPYQGGHDDEGYNREALIGVYGCVVSHEDVRRDHGPFWDAWDMYAGKFK